MIAHNGTNTFVPILRAEDSSAESDAKVAEILARVPEIREAFHNIPGGSALTAVFGTNKVFVDPSSVSAVQTLILVCVLQKQIEEMRVELER